MTTWWPVPEWTKVNYRGPSAFEHPITRLSLFVPHGKPSDYGWLDVHGWPAIVDHRLQAWVSTTMPTMVEDRPPPSVLTASH